MQEKELKLWYEGSAFGVSVTLALLAGLGKLEIEEAGTMAHHVKYMAVQHLQSVYGVSEDDIDRVSMELADESMERMINSLAGGE